jgi:hypothetical protein
MITMIFVYFIDMTRAGRYVTVSGRLPADDHRLGALRYASALAGRS